MKLFFLMKVSFIFCFCSQFVFAKDLSNQMGLGFTTRQFDEVPALSVKYAFSDSHAIEAAFSIETGGDTNTMAVGGRFYRNAYQKENINFFLAIGIFVLRNEVENTLSSGFEVTGLFGAEFFFERIDALGFSIMAGLGLQSSTDGIIFATTGKNLVTAGVHYYF